MTIFFDKDYFENGLATKKSCYENYRWIPELTYPMAFSFIDYLGLKKNEAILEYGCAHGFFVKAMKDFGFNCSGVDISEYAIGNSPNDIKDRLFLINQENYIAKIKHINNNFDYLISKDVFEHIPENELECLLSDLKKITKKIFAVVPLGDNGTYRINSYHSDPTHVIAEDENWWTDLFLRSGFNVLSFDHNVPGIKDKWFEVNNKGNAFILAESKL